VSRPAAPLGPLLPDDGPRGARYARRAKALAIEALALVALTLLAPLLVPVAVLVDSARWVVKRRRFVGVRLLLVGWCFLLGDLRGFTRLLAANVRSLGRDTHRRRRAVYEIRQAWAGGHLDAISRIFGLSWKVEGLETVVPGPVIVLARHASIIDNALPDAVIGRAHGIGLRFVLKRELQALPTIDMGGRWVPTNFVRRGTGDTARELTDLRRLAVALEPDEGVLIFPEGTRWTPAKLARAKEILAERSPAVAPLAARLQNLLPPRLGGPLALLEEGRGTDVVFCGHVGFDGYETVGDIWGGNLVGATIRVQFWRHAAATVPTDREALTAWLYERWQEVDDWIGAQRRAGD
jgi:1-acyl-sn-glycerol-3-phosphate acyltransferase